MLGVVGFVGVGGFVLIAWICWFLRYGTISCLFNFGVLLIACAGVVVVLGRVFAFCVCCLNVGVNSVV